ncbi:hypothetical protein ACFFOS_04400 [Nocardioides kongjuensis]|uniref:Uncharacterized protein n=1 Tax=Nocardioides kongjuensis TaxID=349522 RepID=A0A852RI50_9ACTN|nr:hypothetical protein [Nocardioides kongjuensis]NYD29016.1 hypothetical protein [Nocardioides kongjuensis]
MRWAPLPPRRPPFPVAPGERLLARARVRQPGDGPRLVGGTRDALYLPDRVPWEQVASADWDHEESTLRVVEVAGFGEPSPVHLLRLDDAGRLLELVRERVTASIAVQRHVAVSGRRQVRILARRAPGTRGELAWFVEYDDGLDPADPRVDAVVQEALAAARADVTP